MRGFTRIKKFLVFRTFLCSPGGVGCSNGLVVDSDRGEEIFVWLGFCGMEVESLGGEVREEWLRAREF